ncbi:MAG TPA: hypothetical protein VLC93_09330, partial [Myxococcota bacterium]|nr:hypothetical protein [Myxococcota bacterium]
MKVWLGPTPTSFRAQSPANARPAEPSIRRQSARAWPDGPTKPAQAFARRRPDGASYLDAAKVAELFGELAPRLPAELAKSLETPRIDPRWWACPAPKTIATVIGTDAFSSGKSPWLLASRAALPEGLPDDLRSYLTPVPEGQHWRSGYFPVLADERQSMGAFVALLPPSFDAANPAKSIERIVLTIGSGDNRARSALGELAGYAAPGTLFVSVDMQALSVGMKSPESPGQIALQQGIAYVRRTLGLTDAVPQYLAGFSAGGAAALVQAFQSFPGLKGAAALAPVIMQWNVHTRKSPVPVTIPEEAPGDHFARTAANGQPAIERTFTVASNVVRAYTSEEDFAELSPQRHLARGEMPKVPLLITGGTADLIAQPVVSSAAELASFNKGLTIPVVFGPSDDQAGRVINIEGFARALSTQPGVAVVTLRDVGHQIAAPVKRPDGASWNMDMRDLMLRFFKGLEAA